MPAELRTTGVAAGGDAVARTDGGKVTFVTGALPGELVRAEIVDERRDFDRAIAVEILEPAAGRIAPACPHVARGCGGCAWAHVDLAAQRSLKLDIVTDALRRIGRVETPAVHLGPDLPAEGFRTTIRLAEGRGFRHARSHEIVDIDSCLVAHPLLVALLAASDLSGTKEVVLRCGARTGDRLVLADAPVSVPDDVVVGPKASIAEIVAGRRWRISARSFFQASPEGADALVDAVTEALAGAPDGRFLDAYGGVGLFAGTAGAGRESTIVEWSASSARDARVNVPGAKVVQLDVVRWRPSPAAAVVADPPRTGLGKDVVRVLAATGASHLALVSCDPAALGRDARLLAEVGYEHAGTTLVDLFPQTPHVECVTRFIRA